MDRTQAKLLRALMKQPLSFWQLVGKQDDAIPGYMMHSRRSRSRDTSKRRATLSP